MRFGYELVTSNKKRESQEFVTPRIDLVAGARFELATFGL